MIKVAAAGGGTGGHLYPLLAILETLAKRVDVKVLFFAVKGKIDERVVRKDHPEFETVSIDVRGLLRPLHHPKPVENLEDRNCYDRSKETFEALQTGFSGSHGWIHIWSCGASR